MRGANDGVKFMANLSEPLDECPNKRLMRLECF
jgi:hypothetical protein